VKIKIAELTKCPFRYFEDGDFLCSVIRATFGNSKCANGERAEDGIFPVDCPLRNDGIVTVILKVR